MDYRNLVEQITGRKFKGFVVIEETPHFSRETEKISLFSEDRENIRGFSTTYFKAYLKETGLENRIRIVLPSNLDEYEKTYIIGHELGENMFEQESCLDPYVQIRKFYKRPNKIMGKILVALGKNESVIKNEIKKYLLDGSPLQISRNILTEICLEKNEFAKNFLMAQIMCEKNKTLKRILAEGFGEQVGAELCGMINSEWKKRAEEDLRWRYIEVKSPDERWVYGLGVIFTDYLREKIPNFSEFSSYVFSLDNFNELEDGIRRSYLNSKPRISRLAEELMKLM